MGKKEKKEKKEKDRKKENRENKEKQAAKRSRRDSSSHEALPTLDMLAEHLIAPQQSKKGNVGILAVTKRLKRKQAVVQKRGVWGPGQLKAACGQVDFSSNTSSL